MSQNLNRISLRYRELAGRVLRANQDDAAREIRRLLRFVDETPTLRDTIAETSKPTSEEMQEKWTTACNRHDRIQLPEDDDAELGFLHALLGELSADDGVEFWKKCYRYGGMHGPEEAVQSVVEHLVYKYVRHLQRILDLAFLDADEPSLGKARVIRFDVSGSGNQVNIANDQASLSASQENREEIAEVARLAGALLDASRDTSAPEEDRDTANEIASLVLEQTSKPRPSGLVLRTVAAGLESLGKAAEGGGKIATQAMLLAPHIHHWIDSIKSSVTPQL